MLFNKKTQQIIYQLKDISDKVIFEYPVTGIQDNAKTMMAFINLETLENKPFNKFGLIKVREFFDLLKIVENNETEINFSNDVISITGGGVSCRYMTTSLQVLQDSEVNKNILVSSEKIEPCATFLLDNSKLDMIKKTSAVLNLETMAVEINNGEIKVAVESAINQDSMSIDIPAEKATGEHKVQLSIMNIKKLPLGNYNTKILQHPTNKDNYIISLTPENIPALTILLSTKACKKQ